MEGEGDSEMGTKETNVCPHEDTSTTEVLDRWWENCHNVYCCFQSVGCVKCSFSTASPFSTNLKMHLKAHHKDDYTLVLRLEAQQREEEGLRGAAFATTTKRYALFYNLSQLSIHLCLSVDPYFILQRWFDLAVFHRHKRSKRSY